MEERAAWIDARVYSSLQPCKENHMHAGREPLDQALGSYLTTGPSLGSPWLSYLTTFQKFSIGISTDSDITTISLSN